MQEAQATPSPSTPSSRPWLSRLRRGLGVLLVLVLSLIGLLALLLHLVILPRIDSFRPALENLASRTLGAPVEIGRLSVTERGWNPTIAMDGLVLRDASGSEGLHIARLSATVSLPATLRLGFERLQVEQPRLLMQRRADGVVEVAGLELAQGKSGDSGPALDWLLSQPHIAITQGSLRWSDAQRDAPPLLMTDIGATLKNSGLRHELQLQATPPSGWGQPIQFVSEWSHPLFGDRTVWRDWTGVAYADLAELDLSELRRYMSLGRGIDLRRGKGRMRVWADFKQMRSSTATVEANLNEVDVRLAKDLPPLVLKDMRSMFSVQFAAADNNEAYTLATQQLDFTTLSGQRWNNGNVRVELRNGTDSASSRGHVEGDNWDLGIIGELAGSLPLGDAALDALYTFQPRGHMETLSLDWQGRLDQPDSFAAVGKATDIGWQAQQGPYNAQRRRYEPGTPGVDGADVEFALTERGGRMGIGMRRGHVTLPGVFEEPRIPFDSLDAEVLWQIKDGVIRATLPDVRFANADARGRLQANWRTRPLQPGEPDSARFPGIIQLDARMERANAARVHRYLPLSLGEQARAYVRDAVQAGEIRHARVQVEGDLEHLPSGKDDAGRQLPSKFRFDVPLYQARYQFVPRSLQHADELPWPALTDLQGKLIIDRNMLQIVDARASFSSAPDLRVRELAATIPDLASRNLTVGVAASATGPLSQALHLANTSPLGEIAGNALQQASATGETDLALALGIPVHQIRNIKVDGQVTLKGNDVRITPTTPLLSGSTGVVAFTDKGFALRDVQTRLLGGQARLAGGMDPKRQPGQPRHIIFHAEGDISGAGLREAKELGFIAALGASMEGRSAYRARLQFDRGAPELTIDSDLVGMAVNLPAPLGKSAGESLPLHYENTIVSNYQDRQRGQLMPAEDRLLVRIGNRLSVHYVRDVRGDTPRVLRGSIAAGALAHENLPPLPESDVHALVLLDDVSVDDWIAVLNRISASEPDSTGSSDDGEASLNYLPSVMAIQTSSLTVANRRFDNLVLGGTRHGRLWQVTLDARQINGYVEYLQPLNGQGAGSVKARLARAIIEPAIVQEVRDLVARTEDPETLPALDIEAEQVDVLGYKFDQVTILAGNASMPMVAGAPLVDQPEEDGNGWRIHQLTARMPHGQLLGSGLWGQPRQGTRPGSTPARRFVSLNVRLETDDLGGMLQHFGHPGLVAGGAGALAGTVRWRGSPISVDMNTLGGNVRLDLRRGSITPVDVDALRIVNLLSLQGLSRLGEQHGKGFGFDRIGGTLRLQNGIAHTDDTEVIGTTLADVKVNGQISLLAQTLALDVLVQPKIDLGGAALVAAAVNPVIGVGSFIAQWLLSQSINNAATQVLYVGGPWNAPEVTRLHGSAAHQTALQILASHATPRPVDRLWDWWPITGRDTLLRDWWPITQGRGVGQPWEQSDGFDSEEDASPATAPAASAAKAMLPAAAASAAS